MKTLTPILAYAALIGMAKMAAATPIIVVGEHELLPNTPNQPIEIMVSGGDEVQGLNFRIQVADGGTHPDAGGSLDGPTISNVDLLSGTIFGSNNTGQNDLLRLPQVWVQSTTSAINTVPANGLLATVLIDTTGYTEGEFELHVRDTLDNATDFGGVPADITDGMLRIAVPEPSAFGVLLTGVGLLCTSLRRRVGERLLPNEQEENNLAVGRPTLPCG